MLDLDGTVAFGVLLRNMHRWAAHGMVAVVFLHLCRVFYTGSYRPPREFNWVIGVVLFLLTLGASFTGYLLPWDQLAFWAITVGTAIAGYAPVVGERDPLPAPRRPGRRPGGAASASTCCTWRCIPVADHASSSPSTSGGSARTAASRGPRALDLPEAQPQFPEALAGKLEGLAPAAKTAKTKTFGVHGDRARAVQQGRRHPRQHGLLLAEPLHRGAVLLRAHRPRDPGGGAALPRAARGAGRPHAPAEPLEGALVLPRPPGDGLLLGVLGRRRHPDDLRGAPPPRALPRPRDARASACGSPATGSSAITTLHHARSS